MSSKSPRLKRVRAGPHRDVVRPLGATPAHRPLRRPRHHASRGSRAVQGRTFPIRPAPRDTLKSPCHAPPRRSRRTHAPSGPPVRPRPPSPGCAPTKDAAVLRRHLHRHPVITGEHAPYLRPSTPHPLARAPRQRRFCRSTAPSMAAA
jgi:hypothetical protein